jgi:hypothetical protein
MLVVFFASLCDAQITTITDYRTTVRPGTKITYADLLRRLFPDLSVSADGQSATARTTIALNQLFGDYRDQTYEGAMRIESIDSPGIQEASSRQVLLLVHVSTDDGDLFTWGGISVMALFQLEPAVKLLDAADVQADRFTSIWSLKPLLLIAPGKHAVIVGSSHFNSNQGYLNLSFVTAEKNRLRTIFELPTMLNLRGCGYRIDEIPYITALKDASGSNFKLSLEVRLIKKATADEGCEHKTKGYTKYYRSLLSWNASKHRYQSSGRALNQLSKFNEANY